MQDEIIFSAGDVNNVSPAEERACQRTYNDAMFKDTFEHEYTWLNGFLRNVRRYPDNKAVIDPETGVTLTYKELNEAANALAHALKGDGVGKNDVVMTVIRNCPVFAVTYIAPRKLGAILQPANYKLSAGELALLIDHNQPKVIIYSADVRDTTREAVELCKYKPVRVIMADNLEKYELPGGHTDYDEYIAGQYYVNPEMEVRPHIYDEVIRLCTSGTTALPKSVPLNDINEVLSAHDVIMQYPLNMTDITLNMTPLFHRGGCHSGGCCPTFYAGSTLIVMRVFDAKKVLKWVGEYGITFLTGAPSSLEMLYRRQKKKPADLSSLKGIITMGAPLDKTSCEAYMEGLSPNIFNGYGTTETFWNLLLKPYDLPEGSGSAGSSCIDDEVRVVKIYPEKKAEPDEMVEADGGTDGEVIIHSPAKCTFSYYNNEELEEEKFYKGWMYTGDTGTWKNGLVTIRGRKDDMMIVSGENVYPAQIEEVINANPKVSDCAVTGVPDKDKYRGEVIAAYVVPSDNSLTIAELLEFCANHPMLPEYKCPRYFKFTDSIPIGATGKKLHYKLREMAASDMQNGLLKRKD